jgi:hypothetical protein
MAEKSWIAVISASMNDRWFIRPIAPGLSFGEDFGGFSDYLSLAAK